MKRIDFGLIKTLAAIAAFGVAVIVYLSVPVAIIVIAIHFVRKFW